MSKKPRGLGSGFAALISPSVMVKSAQDQLTNLNIETLQSGRFQPRTQWDEDKLLDLSESIRVQGIVQPIVVRRLSAQSYEIIAGERRWRAAKLAGLQEVPVVIKHISDQEAMAIALIENIQRENLSAIEEAKAIKKLIDTFNLTHDDVAKTLGRSRESISNLLRLLKLSNSVQDAVLAGQLSAGHARALLSLQGDDQQQLALQAISLDWSVRETEQAVKLLLADAADRRPIKKVLSEQQITLPQEIKDWQEKIEKQLGSSVKLKVSTSGKGKLEILFNNSEELQKIMSSF